MKVCLDSMLFIYLFEGDSRYNDSVSTLFSRIEAGKFEAITSLISPLEVLSSPTLKDKAEKFAVYVQFFQKTPHLTLIPLTWEITLAAASLRRTFNLRTPDSIQQATAAIDKADIFITNDLRLTRFSPLPFKVTLIGKYT